MGVKCEIYRYSMQNYKKYGIPKAQLDFREVIMKGICEKCEYMHKSTVSGKKDGKQYKYCGMYNSWCQSVARNCIFNLDRPNKN